MQPDRSWKELAVFGGQPRFVRPLHVNKPNEADRKRLFARLDGMLDRRWFSDGALVREFEAEVARITGTRHCVATCNGTLAIEVAASAMGLTGEVIVPSFTFFATAQSLRWLGLQPRYCDVDARTHNIDPAAAERMISPRTSAIMGVHLWGNPCDVDALQDIADRHGVALLFDAAHAFGCAYRGRAIGGFGRAEVFSFQATKFVNSGEGGAITTNDDTLAERLRAARDLGFDDFDRVIGPGTNAKMSELSAAMGLTYLERIDELIERNRDTLGRYQGGLAGIRGIELFDVDAIRLGNAQFVVTTIDEARAGISRDDILRTLRAENILAKPYFHPGCHRLDRSYSGADGGPGEPLPATELLARTVLVMPGGASITSEEVDGVCRTVRLILAHGEEIRTALINVEEPLRAAAVGSGAAPLGDTSSARQTPVSQWGRSPGAGNSTPPEISGTSGASLLKPDASRPDESLRHLWAAGEPKPLVFIMGLHRSGTTILYQSLSQVLPVVPVTVQDVVFFSRIAASRLRDDGQSDRRRLVEYFEANDLARRGLDDIVLSPETVEEYGWILKRESGSLALNETTLPTFRDLTLKLSWMHRDASALLLKNPWDTSRAAWIASALPEARFVFLLRDPIEILNSELRNAQRLYTGDKNALVQLLTAGIRQMRFFLGLARLGRRALGERRSERFLTWWLLKDVINNLQGYRSAMAGIPPHRMVQVTYGDLVDDTERTLRCVADFLRLPISGGVRELRARRRSGGVHPALETRRAEMEERIKREGLGWALGA